VTASRKQSTDDLGDRMKVYERQETAGQFMPTLPVYARVDGRSFSTLTRNLQRPYDATFAEVMLRTAEAVLLNTSALAAYTQSDEISLVWNQPDYNSDIFFARKKQKLCSVVAAVTTAAFNYILSQSDISPLCAKLPHFDCRVFQLPSGDEVANAFLWRELDATKNAVSMAAHSMYEHHELQGVSGPAMQELMYQRGQNFNDYPDHFKRGTFLRRVTEQRKLTEREREAIPTQHRPAADTMVTRSSIQRLSIDRFSAVVNRAEFLLEGAQPITAAQAQTLQEQ
jgi:tRNA(His) guanylyltransferase